jgi:hypothetical protein
MKINNKIRNKYGNSTFFVSNCPAGGKKLIFRETKVE